MRQKIVAGNWKMNGNHHQLSQLTLELKKELESIHKTKTIIFPPFVYLSQIKQVLGDSLISLGAQNIYPAIDGAYTGEISSSMLNDVQCDYVLVGHSERRHLLKEDENFVAEKFHHAKDHGIIPVLCVGERLEERESKQTEQVIRRQLLAVAKKNKDCFKNCVIAYEPVWAIGTGKTATPEQVQDIHYFIRKLMTEVDEEAKDTSILYGGSVNEKNAQSLFSMPDVDGGLIGGASLNAKQFVEIVKCIN